MHIIKLHAIQINFLKQKTNDSADDDKNRVEKNI